MATARTEKTAGRGISTAMLVVLGVATYFGTLGLGQSPTSSDWATVEDETMRHYQAVLRLDTSNPPGNEHLVAEYIKQVFDREGIPAKILALDPNRSNVVARLKGNGRRRPLLIMGHTDVVTVDPAKWRHPPFAPSATAAMCTAAARWTTRTISPAH